MANKTKKFVKARPEIYGLQFDPSGEIVYSSPSEENVRRLYDSFAAKRCFFSVWAFARVDRYPLIQRSLTQTEEKTKW